MRLDYRKLALLVGLTTVLAVLVSVLVRLATGLDSAGPITAGLVFWLGTDRAVRLSRRS